MITKIISGAQTGADIAGLHTAKKFGIETGGWMPRGFITQDGPRPQYQEWYGIAEHSSHLYPPRTYLNVKESDGTMRFAANFHSSGELCTLKAIRQYNRPCFDVDLLHPEPHSIQKAIAWISDNNIRVLNVAGNAERTHPGTRLKVSGYLIYFLTKLGFLSTSES